MNAAELVDILCADTTLSDMMAQDPHNHQPAIYQVLSSEPDVSPRIAVFESSREYTQYMDDVPFEERVSFELIIYARQNVLYAVNSALHSVMRRNGFVREENDTDDYLLENDLYIKSVTYSKYEAI